MGPYPVILGIPRTFWLRALVLLLAVAFAMQGAGFAVSKSISQLPPTYREWLTKDVAYIITDDEKAAFLKLTNDDDRNKFIETFWAIRNPNPGAPTNSFKEEHYKRLAYANQWFGLETHSEGWKTDRGRVYITLGPPKQKQLYYGYQQLRRFEIWFYSNSHPALPPYFYVVFYQQYDQGEFRLYSPYMDGPDRLVTTDPNDPAQSVQIIDRQAGREVARISLSLLPDEPVDLTTGRATLTSDMMLGTIRGLANTAANKDMLRHRRELLEGVTHRVILGEEFAKLQTVTMRDADGNIDLHYMLRLLHPEDFSIGQGSDGRYYYNVDMTVRVSDPVTHKLIFNRQRETTDFMTKAEYESVKQKSFAYEGMVPLAPGKYSVEFVLTNKLHHQAVRSSADIVVPEPPAAGLMVSGIVPFTDAEQLDPGTVARVPFSGGGVRFMPLSAQNLEYTPGEDLKFFYQIWAPAADPRQFAGKRLKVEYAWGRVGMTGDMKTFHDDVDRTQFDRTGSMLNGKRIQLTDAQPGNYRLVVTVTDPETQQKGFSAFNFGVAPSRSDLSNTWYVYDQQSSDPAKTAEDFLDRGLSYLASGKKDVAVSWLRASLERNPAGPEALRALVEEYLSKQDYASMAALFPKVTVTNRTDDQTLLRLADALQRSGKLQDAVSLLESAVKSRPQTGAMFLALSSCYRQLGQTDKANEMERRGKSLMASTASAS